MWQSAVEFVHKLDLLFKKGKIMNLYKAQICLKTVFIKLFVHPIIPWHAFVWVQAF